MRHILSLSAVCLSIAAMAPASYAAGADKNLIADNTMSVPQSWVRNDARRADTSLILTRDASGRVVKACGNISGECEVTAYPHSASNTAAQGQ